MSKLEAILAGKVFAPWAIPGPQTILVQDGRIAAIRPGITIQGENAVLDARDALIVPGLIDLQVNGAMGWSFQAEDRSHFSEIAGYHASHGTTTFLPTLVSAPEEVLVRSLETLAEAIPQIQPVTLAGIHLEGPFLSPEKSGAHDPAALRLPDHELMERLLRAGNYQIRMVTLAPELPGAGTIIRQLSDEGVIASGGHSAGKYTDFQAAVAAGLRFLTHAGNASDWPHRAMNEHGFLGSEPGLVGSLMAIPELGASLIMDGFHFHPALLQPLIQLKGIDHLILVSDAAPVAGLPPGEYESGSLHAIIHSKGFATSGRGGGWLAGSLITLLDAVRKAVEQGGIPLSEALTMATQSPAWLLGLQGRKGELRPQADADLLVLNQDLSLRHVVIGGRIL